MAFDLFLVLLFSIEENFGISPATFFQPHIERSSCIVISDDIRQRFGFFVTIEGRGREGGGAMYDRGVRSEFRVAKSQGRWILREEYDKSRYKAYSGWEGGLRWCTRAPCCSADDAWRRDTIAFPDSRIICQRPGDAKKFEVHSFLRSLYLLAIVDHSPTMSLTDACRKSPIRVPSCSPFSAVFFSSFHFFFTARTTFLTMIGARGGFVGD